MDKAAKGWLATTARKMHWRVRGLVDVQELIQDGLLLHHIITVRYQNARTPSQRMALFKTSFQNHITDLSRKQCRCAHVVLAGDVDIDLSLIPQDEDVPRSQAEPPPCIQRLISECAARPHRFRMPRRCKPDGTRETESEWLSRVAGFEVPADAHLQLLAYMRG
jgi:hypothetical protein